MQKRPTIRDVAARTNLSVSTVSLVINNRGSVRDHTRKKVLEAIEELGYHPTHTARGLASKSSGNFGFILQDDHFSQAEPFYTKIFLGAEFESRNHDYYILLTTVSKQFNLKSEIPRFLLEHNVDGVIIAGKISEKLVDYIDELGIPLILVDYELKRKRFSSVLIDNHRGVEDAILHLIRIGRKDIAFIAGDLNHPSMSERFMAYKESMTAQGCCVDENLVVVDEPDTGLQNGFSAAEKIFKKGFKPSAVFAANDAMAIGFIQYLKQQEIIVPDDVAVVGFDDIELCTHIEPTLTTVRVFKEELGKIAVQRLAEAVESKSKAIVTTRVPVELIVRDSSPVPVESSVAALQQSSVLPILS